MRRPRFGTAAMVEVGMLGVLITLSEAALYEPHYLTTWDWALTPLEDQQLTGLTMSAPAAGLHLGSALVLAGGWLGAASDEAQAR